MRRDLPGAKLIFVTQYNEALYLDEARRLGVSAYVSKHSASTELLRAIAAVQKGQTYFSPRLSPPQGRRSASITLTLREREVLQLVAEGNSLKEMAFKLGISTKTVQFHKANITCKLGLHSTAELAKFAVRHGMTPP